MNPITARTLAEMALAVTTKEIGELSTELDAARLARAAAVARLHDEHGLSYADIASMQPGLTRQWAAHLAAQGRKHIESTVEAYASNREDAIHD